MKDQHFVVGCTADGTTFDGPLTKEELEERLDEEYYGEDRIKFVLDNPGTDGFCISLGDAELLIIEGSIVQPKEKTMVVKWEL